MKASIKQDTGPMKNRKRTTAVTLSLFITIIMLCLANTPACSAAPRYEWTKTMGGAAGSGGRSVAVDASGNIYVTGYFSGSIDFDPGLGVDTHISGANLDMFLTRVNADGTYAWTKTTAGAAYACASGSSVAIDGGGNAYVTGRYCRTVDFDPGVGADYHTSTGYNDIFLTRINADGSYAWTKTMDGTALGYGYGESVAIDGDGNVYLTGHFSKTVDFDPGPGVDSHAAGGTSFHIFLTRINTDGSYAWTKSMGGSSYAYSLSASTDAGGNIYLSGFFGGAVDFDPGAGEDIHASAGYDDVFLTRINADGSYAWTRAIGGTGADRSWSSAAGPDGSIYVSGSYSNTVDFDPTSGVDARSAAGQNDHFLMRINSDGTYGWTKTISDPPCCGNGSSNGYSVAVDPRGNIYLTGYFSGTIDFDPGAGVDSRSAAGSQSVFLTRMDADGSYSWTKTAGSPSSWFNSAMPLAADAGGNLFITGRFSNTVDFDPGPGIDSHTSHGAYGDIFLTRFSQKLEDLAVDFGAVYGLYARYDDATWTQLSPLSPLILTTGDMDGDGSAEVIAGIAGTGVWAKGYGADMVRLHPLDAELIVAADLDGNGQDEVIVDFGTLYGTWARYNNGAWTKLHGLSPIRMTTGDLDGNGQADVIGDFAGLGIWARYNNTAGWTRLHYLDAELIAAGDLNGDGQDEAVVDFGDAYGVWARYYNTGVWAKIHSLSPAKLIAGDLDGNGQDEVIGDFASLGIWGRYNNKAKWALLHGFFSDALAIGDLDGSGRDELIVDFGIFGIWGKYNNNAWKKIHNVNPELMGAGNLDGN